MFIRKFNINLSQPKNTTKGVLFSFFFKPEKQLVERDLRVTRDEAVIAPI